MDINTNILSWNVRGLNKRCRHDALRGVVTSANASIVCIQETKLSVIDQHLVNAMLGSQYTSFSYLPASRTRGGVLIAGRRPDVSIHPHHVGFYSVIVEVKLQDVAWHLTSVYGPQADVDKVEFLNELRTVRATIPGP